jgi:acetylornithine deacetylase/succinyl-diaminopimelate desuccinylase-like protein
MAMVEPTPAVGDEALARAMDSIDRDRLKQVATDLIRIPSPTGSERAVAEYIEQELTKLGLRVRRHAVSDDRFNVSGTLPGNGDGLSLMLTGHMDSCNPNGQLQVEGDWVFGPGAANMKGFFASAIEAVRAVLASGVELSGDLIVTAVVGECERAGVDAGFATFAGPAFEAGGIGTERLLRDGASADLAVIGEPTGLRVQSGNAGYVLLRVTTRGRPQHARSKQYGSSALDKLLRIVERFPEWEAEYKAAFAHPRMELVTNLGSIASGLPYTPVITPTFAHAFVYATTLPGVPAAAVEAHLSGFIERLADGDPGLRADVEVYSVRRGYELDAGAYVTELVRASHLAVVGAEPEDIEPLRYSVSSDGPTFQSYGIHAVTYGPAGITQSGAYLVRDELTGLEALNVANLETAAKVYTLAALTACTTPRAAMGGVGG